MNLKSFATMPIGNDGLYAVQRSHRGVVQYLAAPIDKTKVARVPRDLAERTVRVLTHNDTTGAFTERDDHWLPWPTDHLPYGRPMSMFPPSRASILT